MSRAKRIFMLADFKDEKPWSMCLDERRIIKGFIRLGHDVQRFSYRNIMMQCSPFPSKRLARHFAKGKTDDVLAKQVKTYCPDIIFVASMKYFGPETIHAMRSAAPNAVLVGRDGDPFPDRNPARIEIGREMDIVTMPSAGSFLKTYKEAGVRRCAFIPFSCDPDIQYRHAVNNNWKTDMVFLGAAEHSRLNRDVVRYELARRLHELPNAMVYACFGQPKTQGFESFYALSGAKIGLSINIANDVRLYHSDRYVNIPACGTFCLAKRAPDYELLFEDKVHMRYFDEIDEFFELAKWYLEHEEEREKNRHGRHGKSTRRIQ